MSSSPPSLSLLQRPRQSPWPAVSMAEAWKTLEDKVGQQLGQLRAVEQRHINDPDLLGTSLAQPVHAIRPVPAFRASIKDGYAVLATDGPGPRRVVANSTAGGTSSTKGCLRSGECVRISTGARVPDGADAVVQVEDTELLEHDGNEELVVSIGSTPRPGQDIREVGSDVAKGELLLDKGASIGPAECGLLALSGSNEVTIFRRPQVCVLSTGDELVDALAGEQVDEEKRPNAAVVDTNRPALLALLRAEGFVPVDCGIARDSRETLVEIIGEAFERANVLVVTGGVSMGEKDLLKHILVHHFHLKIHFGRVFMKPGLPSTFASGRGPDGRPKLVFGLPGNPVSALVTAHLFLLPQLRRIAGAENYWENARIAVRLSHPIRPLDVRPEFRRALLIRPAPGEMPSVPPDAQCLPGSQISSRLLSVRSANLLLELPGRAESREELEAGEMVTALVIGAL